MSQQLNIDGLIPHAAAATQDPLPAEEESHHVAIQVPKGCTSARPNVFCSFTMSWFFQRFSTIRVWLGPNMFKIIVPNIVEKQCRFEVAHFATVHHVLTRLSGARNGHPIDGSNCWEEFASVDIFSITHAC